MLRRILGQPCAARHIALGAVLSQQQPAVINGSPKKVVFTIFGRTVPVCVHTLSPGKPCKEVAVVACYDNREWFSKAHVQSLHTACTTLRDHCYARHGYSIHMMTACPLLYMYMYLPIASTFIACCSISTFAHLVSQSQKGLLTRVLATGPAAVKNGWYGEKN